MLSPRHLHHTSMFCIKVFYAMGTGLSGKLSCMLTGLVIKEVSWQDFARVSAYSISNLFPSGKSCLSN